MEGAKKETILPHIPYREEFAPRAVSYQLTADLLGSQEPIQRGGGIASALDLHRTPKSMTDQDVLNAVSTHLGISLGALEKTPRTEGEKAEYEKALTDINTALAEAKSYIERVLGLRAPTAQVGSKKDAVELVRKTALYGEPDRKGLETHAGYCALLSVTLAIFELHKKEAHMLKDEMRSLEEFLTEPSESNGGSPLFGKRFAVDNVGPTIVTLNGVSPLCQPQLLMRDKAPDSQITKYLARPESNATEALKDAIGIRLEIENKRVEDVLLRVLTYLTEHMDATDLRVEDRNILGEKGNERLDVFEVNRSLDVPGGDTIPVTSDKNPLSADTFRVVKILGNIKIPGKDMRRSIEIQVVEPDNKNERKLASHAVYELKKKITVMTRLFGGCSEAWLKAEIRKISTAPGYPEKIIRGLKDEVGFMMQLSGTRKVYGATSVYERWMDIPGLIEDSAVRKQVAHGLDQKARTLEKTLKAKG